MRLKVGSTCASLLGAALIVSGCGGDNRPPTAPNVIDDVDSSVPRDAGPRRDGGDDAGLQLGPDVKVLAPLPAEGASSENVLTGSSVKVRCSAIKSKVSEVVDPSSVKVALYPEGKTTAIATQAAKSTAEAGVFEADLSLADAPHGTVRIECQASDVGDKPQQALASISTLYDEGPAITFLSPEQGGFVASGKGAGEDVRVRFRVEPRELGDEDDGAAVKEVAVTVEGKPFTAVQAGSEPNVYTFGLDFNDTRFFSVVPETLSIVVKAATARIPLASAVGATLTVGVDSDGPKIVVKSPARVNSQDPVVSGKVDVVLEVTDALGGVDPSSVELRIEKKGGGGFIPYMAIPSEMPNQFVTSFHTGTFPGMPSLSVTLVARDKAQNETQSSMSIDIDTVPPWISLNPPKVRELIMVQGEWRCSGGFDPLGDAVGPGVVPQAWDEGQNAYVPAEAYRVRALIWDRPLSIPGVTSLRYAMINPATPRLFIQHNTDTPLLIDSDKDDQHLCDKVNTDVAKPPVPITLSPVAPKGAAIPAGFWDTTTPPPKFVQFYSDEPSAVGAGGQPICRSIDAQFNAPQPVATDTTMTRVIRHSVPGNYAVVFADSPTESGIRNTGKDYVVPTRGWACLVAVAEDNAGNAAFSEPMAVCTETTTGDCGGNTPPASVKCTDGCVMPDHFLTQPTGPVKGMEQLIYYY